MATLTFRECLMCDDFVKGKLTVAIILELKGHHTRYDVLNFKVNETLWKESDTYKRRIMKKITPIINDNVRSIMLNNP